MLWTKYRFNCCCKRCSAEPASYVDCALQVRLTKIESNFFFLINYVVVYAQSINFLPISVLHSKEVHSYDLTFG